MESMAYQTTPTPVLAFLPSLLATKTNRPPLAFNQWLPCAGMASVVLWYSELGKLVGRAWARPVTAEAPSGAKPLDPKPKI